jgi:hypothetical protein
MRFFRILFPFLFIRNWYTGDLELSPTRVWLFVALLLLFVCATIILIVLQAPLEYASKT